MIDSMIDLMLSLGSDARTLVPIEGSDLLYFLSLLS
jgi:hypothetical protein